MREPRQHRAGLWGPRMAEPGGAHAMEKLAARLGAFLLDLGISRCPLLTLACLGPGSLRGMA